MKLISTLGIKAGSQKFRCSVALSIDFKRICLDKRHTESRVTFDRIYSDEWYFILIYPNWIHPPLPPHLMYSRAGNDTLFFHSNWSILQKTMDAKVKRDKKPRISRQKRIADIISVNWEIVNCGKRGTVKAINTDRTATASNFFLPLKNS